MMNMSSKCTRDPNQVNVQKFQQFLNQLPISGTRSNQINKEAN